MQNLISDYLKKGRLEGKKNNRLDKVYQCLREYSKDFLKKRNDREAGLHISALSSRERVILKNHQVMFNMYQKNEIKWGEINIRDKTIEVLVKEDYQKQRKNINSQKKLYKTRTIYRNKKTIESEQVQ